MKPRPIHRWKSFWLGLLVIGFLGWAWWLSYGNWSLVGYRRMTLSQLEGYVSAGAGASLPRISASHQRVIRDEFNFRLLPPPFLERGGEKALDPAELVVRDFQEWVRRFYAPLTKDYWRVFVPHWLVMLAFLVAWVGFLVWRLRRMKRLDAGDVYS